MALSQPPSCCLVECGGREEREVKQSANWLGILFVSEDLVSTWGILNLRFPRCVYICRFMHAIYLYYASFHNQYSTIVYFCKVKLIMAWNIVLRKMSISRDRIRGIAERRIACRPWYSVLVMHGGAQQAIGKQRFNFGNGLGIRVSIRISQLVIFSNMHIGTVS